MVHHELNPLGERGCRVAVKIIDLFAAGRELSKSELIKFQ